MGTCTWAYLLNFAKDPSTNTRITMENFRHDDSGKKKKRTPTAHADSGQEKKPTHARLYTKPQSKAGGEMQVRYRPEVDDGDGSRNFPTRSDLSARNVWLVVWRREMGLPRAPAARNRGNKHGAAQLLASRNQ